MVATAAEFIRKKSFIWFLFFGFYLVFGFFGFYIFSTYMGWSFLLTQASFCNIEEGFFLVQQYWTYFPERPM